MFGKITLWFKLARIPNLFIMASLMTGVRYEIVLPRISVAGIESGVEGIHFVLLVLSVLFIAAGGYLINDIFDIEIDKQNKPDRQWVGNMLTVGTVKVIYILLTLLGVVSGLYLSWQAKSVFLAVFFSFMAALMYYYSERYKARLIVGNFVVSFSAAMVVVLPWLFEFKFLNVEDVYALDSFGVFDQLIGLVYFYSFFAFLTTLIREIIKDIEDIEGDKQAGCQTLPVVLGVSISKWIASFLLMMLMVSLGWWQYRWYKNGLEIAAFVLVIAEFLTIAVVWQLVLAGSVRQYKRVSALVKWLMISGITTMLFLNL